MIKKYDKYDLVSRILHFLIILATLSMTFMGIYFKFASKIHKHSLMSVHKSLGFTLMILIFMLFIWKISFMKKPKYKFKISYLNKVLALFTHYLLYLLVFSMTLSGFLGSLLYGKAVYFWELFAIKPLFVNKNLANCLFKIHGFLVWILLFFIILHLIGAFFHFFKKEQLLNRMF